ncbi:MAG: hypothetical protein V2A70_01155 [Candidatus Omnitrophota bacterium]
MIGQVGTFDLAADGENIHHMVYKKDEDYGQDKFKEQDGKILAEPLVRAVVPLAYIIRDVIEKRHKHVPPFPYCRVKGGGCKYY